MTDTTDRQPVVATNQVRISLGDKLIQETMTFVIGAGEFVAILGPNGAGKSTLLRLLLGLLQPDTGTVSVLGQPPRIGNRAIGYMPQFHGLDTFTTLRARDIVGFGLDGHRWGIGLFNKKRDAAIDQILTEVDAAHLGETAFGNLSGGERQRILLAQTLLSNPSLLLLDEPLAGLDIGHAQEVINLVQGICRRRQVAVLFVTHEVNPLLPVIDKVLYLANGRCTIGTSDEVINSAVLSSLYGSSVEVVTALGRRFVVGVET
jgi:zinc/manganese transport system ATP-binding protein